MMSRLFIAICIFRNLFKLSIDVNYVFCVLICYVMPGACVVLRISVPSLTLCCSVYLTNKRLELERSVFPCQDPLETIRAKCEQSEHCAHTQHRLEACTQRVSSRDATEEDCTEELFDFLHARDHCVSVWKRGVCV